MSYLLYTLFLSLQVVCIHAAARLTTARWTSSSSGEQLVGQPFNTTSVTRVQIALTLQNLAMGEDALIRLTESVHNGLSHDHWSLARVAQTFAPSEDSVREVLLWIGEREIDPGRARLSSTGFLLNLDLQFHEVCRLLNATMVMYDPKLAERDGTYRRSADEWIPEHLVTHIDYIALSGNDPDLGVSLPRRSQQISQVGPGTPVEVDCDKLISPACLRQLYNIPAEPVAHPESTIGIYEPDYVSWLAEDLDLFFKSFQPELVGKRPILESINNGHLQVTYKIDPFNLEPNLDFQYSMALTSPTEMIDLQVGGPFRAGTLHDLFAEFDATYCRNFTWINDTQAMLPGLSHDSSPACGGARIPKVISISFADSEASYSPKFLQRQCFEFLKLGLMGVTVVAASGDLGTASSYAPGVCLNTTTGRAETTSGGFSPNWPGTCPWVTVVGGSQLVTQMTRSDRNSSTTLKRNGTKETALWKYLSDGRIMSSGGGFSNVFATPRYQRKAVKNFESTEHAHLNNFRSLYNSSGRAHPDLSVQARGYLMYLHGKLRSTDGTSASAPVFASMIALINNERYQAGKRSLGFINPILYDHPEIFNDIDSGANEGCGLNPAFRAVDGWDPVTGLGTPNFMRMKNVLLNLP